MSISFTNSTDVFIFIIFCSVYVCSILWIYGDAATRDMGIKGAILPLIFVIAAVFNLILSILSISFCSEGIIIIKYTLQYSVPG